MNQKSSQHLKTNSLLTKNETDDFATIKRETFKKQDNIYNVRCENNSQDTFQEHIKDSNIQKLERFTKKFIKIYLRKKKNARIKRK